jgi:hypothetical protein
MVSSPKQFNASNKFDAVYNESNMNLLKNLSMLELAILPMKISELDE